MKQTESGVTTETFTSIKLAVQDIADRSIKNIDWSIASPQHIDVNVPVYLDKHGHPACAINFKERKVCPFYLQSSFGQKEVCFFGAQLWRRDDGMGSLIPDKRCPIHGDRE